MKIDNNTLRALEVLSQVVWAMVGSFAFTYGMATIPNAPLGVAVFYAALFFVPIVIYLCFGLFSTAPPFLYLTIAICVLAIRAIPTGLELHVTMILQLLGMSTGLIAFLDFSQSKRRYPVLVDFLSAALVAIGLAILTVMNDINSLAVAILIYTAGASIIQVIWTRKGVLKWV